MSPRPNPSEKKQQLHSHPTAHPRLSPYYQPSAYTFTCRGGFHIKSLENGTKNQQQRANKEGNDESEIAAILRDKYICNGIETKLKKVADYPLARNKEEALSWFEGHLASGGLQSKTNEEKGGMGRYDGQVGGGVSSQAAERRPSVNETNEQDADEDAKFSSYGTTQVNILTLKEVVPSEDQRRLMDSFAGFGPLPPSIPFGGILGGFFGSGGGELDWFNQENGTDRSGQDDLNNRSWVRGSRSVSSSTRTGRDENGKVISTTVKKTTIVDADGNKRTETETTIRHLEEGGRIEKTKVIHDESKNKASPGQQQSEKTNQAQQPAAPTQSANQIAPVNNQTNPPEVAMISTDIRLGLSIKDSKMKSNDPALPEMGDSDKWRQTEYLFMLGKLFPALGVVFNYYDDEEEQKKYDEQRQRQKKSRWDKSAERNTGDSKEESLNTFALSKLPDTSRAKYYLDRISDQMEKNANMMKLFVVEMTKPDFPKKVYYSGQKIAENMGPTVERTGKLMKDVFGMWFGGLGVWGDDGGRRR